MNLVRAVSFWLIMRDNMLIRFFFLVPLHWQTYASVYRLVFTPQIFLPIYPFRYKFRNTIAHRFFYCSGSSVGLPGAEVLRTSSPSSTGLQMGGIDHPPTLV